MKIASFCVQINVPFYTLMLVERFIALVVRERTVQTMSEATITISVEEYMDLRQRADMNGMLMQELGEFRGRLFTLENRLFELEGRCK